jgi:23S rRNA pseudouridine1911/1915/1917 synthase
MEWQIELADDMKALLEAMRHEDPPLDDEEHFEFSEGPYLSDEDYEDDDELFDEDDSDLDEADLLDDGEDVE